MLQLHFPDEIPVSEEEVQIWLDTISNHNLSARPGYRLSWSPCRWCYAARPHRPSAHRQYLSQCRSYGWAATATAWRIVLCGPRHTCTICRISSGTARGRLPRIPGWGVVAAGYAIEQDNHAYPWGLQMDTTYDWTVHVYIQLSFKPIYTSHRRLPLSASGKSQSCTPYWLSMITSHRLSGVATASHLDCLFQYTWTV